MNRVNRAAQAADRFDVYPAHAQYRPGQSAGLIVEVPTGCADDVVIEVSVFHHQFRLRETRMDFGQLCGGQGVIDLGVFPEGGYHVAARLQDVRGECAASTAFDVRTHWREAPRYSFLCDFAPSGSHAEMQTFFRRFHLNVTQFYDWMERHDALVPRTPEFVDPMGRRLYTEGIVSRLRALKDIQTASIAYAAVYAALSDYALAHPDEGIYDNRGVQLSLIDIFYLMDISAGSAWRGHILAEFRRVLEFGFDGLHLDQYGFPKSARRRDGTVYWLDNAYRSFIDECRRTLGEEAGLIFNAVSSYPLHTVCASEQDAVYIEVWPPMVRYRHLAELIARTRQAAAGSKQVILAAYLKAFRSEPGAPADAKVRSALLVTTIIYASGGYHLVLGESVGMLTEPYYPDYVPMVPELQQPLRALYDIVTADAELLCSADIADVSWSFAGGINRDILVEGAPISVEPEAGTVWVRVTQSPRGLLIHLVNLLWLEHDRWNEIHREPFRPAPALDVSIEFGAKADAVWVQRAETPGWRRAEDSWKPHDRGEALHVSVPSFDVWAMILVP